MTEQPQHDPWVDPQFEQNVRDTAYFLWENDGRPTGREQLGSPDGALGTLDPAPLDGPAGDPR